MKRNVKLATALALVLASSAALADGFSSLATIGTGVGGSAYGTEVGTQGGFCSATGGLCANGTAAPIGTAFVGTTMAASLTPTVGQVVGVAPIAGGTAVTGATLVDPATLGQHAIESASGAGITGNTGVIAPITGTGGAVILDPNYQGTYTALNAYTVGAYNVTGGQDPGSAANVTGNTYALQKSELGIANSGNTTSATATALRGQAASLGSIATTAQAVTPNSP